MKRFLRNLCLVMAMAMCLALPVRADGLLEESMQAAYEAGHQVEGTVSIRLGDGLGLFLPEQTFSAVQQVLQQTRIRTRWAKDEAGEPVLGLQMSIQDVELLTGELRVAGDSALVTTSLLPGKTLLLPAEGVAGLVEQPLQAQLDGQMEALLGEAGERYLGVLAAWAGRVEGAYTASELETAPTDVRGGSVRSDHLVVTAAQVKDLLVLLADEFAKDEALQSALGQSLQASGQDIDMKELTAALSQGVQGLMPLDGALKLDIYQGGDAEIVGVDLMMDALFAGAPQTVFAQYDNLSEDGRESFAFQGRLGLPDGGMAATKITYSETESHTEPTIDTDLLLLGMHQPTGVDPVSQITLTDARHTEKSDAKEHMEDALTLTMEQLIPDGSASVEGAMSMAAAMNTVSDTSAGADGGFESDTGVTLMFMGMEMGAVSLTLATGEYAPQDISGNATIDLSKVTAEEQQALIEELQAGLTLAAMNAVAVLPPELLQMMQ